MNCRRLFVLVEGDDDERFFLATLNRGLQDKYDWVSVWKYAQQKASKVAAFLRSIKAMGADYIYLADMNQAPCITKRREHVLSRRPHLEPDRMCVVVAEIESWYLAGLDAASSRRLGIGHHRATDGVDKEQFDKLIPSRFDSRVDFMIEMLKSFSEKAATRQNRSFRYFVRRFDC